MRKYYLTIIFVLFLFISCNDNPTEVNNESFNVEIQVVNSNNNPLSNINVSIWSKINYSTTLEKTNTEDNSMAATSIYYSLPEQCFVELISYDLNDNLKEKIVTGHYDAGYYEVTFNMNYIIGTGVYKCKLITSSDSLHNNILFKDSIYIVLLQPDPVVSALGKTDNNGKLKTSNKLLFPHLFNLPAIPHTSEASPEILSYFTFSDSVTIALSDELFSKTIYYDRPIKNGENKFTLEWNDTLMKLGKQKIINKNKSRNILVIKKLSDVPKDWKLYQNYPNPFN